MNRKPHASPRALRCFTTCKLRHRSKENRRDFCNESRRIYKPLWARRGNDMNHSTMPITIPMEDPIIHTDECPICCDLTCPCHVQEYAIIQANHPMLGMIGTITDVTPDGFLRFRIGRSSFAAYFRPGGLLAV